MRLQDQQAIFIRSLWEPRLAERIMRSGPGLAPGGRIEVYRGSIIGSYVRSLAHSHPITRSVIGVECFEVTAADYALHELNDPPPLETAGAGFADHLERLPAGRVLPYIGDLARLEWIWHQAGLAPEDACLTPRQWQATADIAPNRLHLLTSASLEVVEVEYGVHSILEIYLREGDDFAELRLAHEPVRLAAWRHPQHGRRLQVISESQLRFIQLLQSRRPWQDVVDALEAAPQSAGQILAWALGAAWVVGYSCG